MGKGSKALSAFIDDIPDAKLTGLPTTGGKLHSDDNFRLDMQGMTSDKPPKHNLQIQVNNQTTISTLKKMAPATAAGPVLVDSSSPASAAEIKAEFKEKMKI